MLTFKTPSRFARRTFTQSLLIDFTVDVAVGVLYGWTGLLLARRHVSEEARAAAAMFSLWWFGLAMTGFLAAGITLAAALGSDLAVLVALSHVITLPFSLGLWGLTFYLVYLFTGNKKLLAPLGVLYGLYYILQVYLLTIQHPTGYDASGWRPMLDVERPVEGLWTNILLALPLLPLLFGMVGFAYYFRKADDLTLRYRMGLITTSLTTWIVAVVLISRPELAADAYWQILARIVILASALTILFAYRPPKWVQHRWRIRSTL